MPLSPMRTFEIVRVEFFRIKSIDAVAQQFEARVYVELVVRGGAEFKDFFFLTTHQRDASPTSLLDLSTRRSRL